MSSDWRAEAAGLTIYGEEEKVIKAEARPPALSQMIEGTYPASNDREPKKHISINFLKITIFEKVQRC